MSTKTAKEKLLTSDFPALLAATVDRLDLASIRRSVIHPAVQPACASCVNSLLSCSAETVFPTALAAPTDLPGETYLFPQDTK